jgi:hypothetical protein
MKYSKLHLASNQAYLMESENSFNFKDITRVQTETNKAEINAMRIANRYLQA